MDTVYPQPIRLVLDTSSRRKRGSQNRYRTQPVTFSEIKEVDEETAEEPEAELNRRMSAESPKVLSSKSSTNVNAKFEELFNRKRPEKKISRKLQNRLDLAQKSSATTRETDSPENGVRAETINLLPKFPSSRKSDDSQGTS